MTGALRGVFAPLAPLYRAGLAWREWRLASGREPVRRLRSPVVSIGNLSTGGAGKTPLAIGLARALNARGLRVDVLSRGYGRQSCDPARVRVDGTAEEFGDEPLLIAREAGVPVYVAPQRYDAGLLAEAGVGEGLVHVLDDGFQHRQLHRDIDILLLSRSDWRGRLLPAGNLREPLQAARRASVIAIPANEPEMEPALRAWGWRGPVWALTRRMEVPHVDGPVLAFCGIARAQQFFAGLEAAGVRLAARKAFPDHHRYSAGDLDALLAEAARVGAAALMTTEKDEVRLGNRALRLTARVPLRAARLRVEIGNETPALDWLASRLAVNSAGQAL